MLPKLTPLPYWDYNTCNVETQSVTHFGAMLYVLSCPLYYVCTCAIWRSL